MKHLPNLLTLGNLFCGCIAIAYILSAQPFLSNYASGQPYWDWVYGAPQLYLGSLFIGIAAVCDMLDGLTARALKVFSPIGKDLDSLADLVSFGVAPATILFKLLWDCIMTESDAIDASMLQMAPAFLVACFAALRLAKFNITADKQKSYFIGMPTPAVGLFIASLPLIAWYSPGKIGMWLQHKWVLYAIIAFVCWLMVSGIKCFKLFPIRWPHIVLAVVVIASVPFIKFAAIPLSFIVYVILSMIYRHPETEVGFAAKTANNNQ